MIGHEITHGFDDRGRQFDKDGNNKNWWDHQTDLNFRNRTQCMVDQYSNYTVPENGLQVNGVNTQGENIADNGQSLFLSCLIIILYNLSLSHCPINCCVTNKRHTNLFKSLFNYTLTHTTGGLKEAFLAYKKWVKDHEPEKSLPGLPYSPDQLFWISAANVWCGKYRNEVLRLRVMVGSHSPPMFRVIGPMSNIQEFSNSFNCPLGSNMNPSRKCAVW